MEQARPAGYQGIEGGEGAGRSVDAPDYRCRQGELGRRQRHMNPVMGVERHWQPDQLITNGLRKLSTIHSSDTLIKEISLSLNINPVRWPMVKDLGRTDRICRHIVIISTDGT